MKKVVITIIIIIGQLYGQTITTLTPDKELFVGTENIPEGITVTFVLEAISTVWDRYTSASYENYLTTDFHYQI